MVVYYFEVYMIPTVALLILLKHYIVTVLTGTSFSHQILMQPQDYNEPFLDDSLLTAGEDDEEEDEKDKEEKKSLKERLQAIQDVTQMVQNSIGFIASLCEKMKNLFNFTVPFLSYLAILLILLSIMVLYMIPVRYIILIWGINKFARKIIRPHAIANNELLDLISRVPDDEELLNYRELKLITTSDCESLTGRISNKTYLSSGSITSRRELRKRQKTNMLP